MPMVAKWRSDVYHLLPTCHVYIKVRIKFPASDCLLSLFCYTPSYKGDVMDRENAKQ